MASTYTEIEGKAQKLLALLLKEMQMLIAAGINVDLFVKTLTAKIDRTNALNAEQEDHKRNLKETTAKVEGSYHDLDVTTSGFLDAIMGAIGKNTAAAKNFQLIRSRVRMPDSEANATTPGERAPEGQA